MPSRLFEEKLFDEGEARLSDLATLRCLRRARLPPDWLRVHRTPQDSETFAPRRAAILAACRDHDFTQLGEGRGLDPLR